MMELSLTNMQLLSSQDVNWWTGVVWIIVMFLSAVWTLISPQGKAMLHFSKSVLMKKLIYILDVSKFS